MNLNERYYTETGWDIGEKSFTPEDLVSRGSIFLVGNGYLGYRGTFPDWRSQEYVGCFIAGAYDNADGKWTELVNAPNALYTRLEINEQQKPLTAMLDPEKQGKYTGRLNLQNGVLEQHFILASAGERLLEVNTERFASYEDLHIIPMRFKVKALAGVKLALYTGIDSQTWDLNGKHLPDLTFNIKQRSMSVTGMTKQSGLEVAVFEGHNFGGIKPLQVEVMQERELVLRKYNFELQPGDEIILEKVMSVFSSFDLNNPLDAAAESLFAALGKGFDLLKSEHRLHWQAIWDNLDIKIEGDLVAQALVRYNLYHAVISAPMHSDNLPIGARGLSCQAYQGAAFWDQEIFNLPLFTWTMPDVSRKILTYRYKTLDGARRKAKRLGYRGAFYAWVSGKSGDELCPSFFFIDVLTGRKIRNHFNDWQIHISPDIVYAIWEYYRVTGDLRFLWEAGAEIVFEVARFLYSHAYFKKDKDRYEFIRLLGPDEYHENVDNNAYTNYMAHFSLETACMIKAALKKDNFVRFEKLLIKLAFNSDEFADWRKMADKLYLPLPDPNTGLLEQFDGYLELEDTTPGKLEKRLLDQSEYWGWPNGVAVHTQVIKQADVLQLFALNDSFAENQLANNYDYYAQRCHHGSSLSPSVHSIIAARLGRVEEAYDYFKRSCLIDLSSSNKTVSGGTFIGGIHTAACGAAWQIIMFGFLGMKLEGNRITFNPKLPENWESVSFKLITHGRQQQFKIS